MTLTAKNKGGLGLWMLTALVAGNIIGSGIFLLPASLAHYGSISILSWIFTGIGAIFIALVFAKLSILIPKTGGPYAYCRAGFGDFIGFQVAYNYWIALCVGNAAIVVALVGYLEPFWPALHTNVLLSFFVKIAFVWIMALINILGIRNVGNFQLITTILKLLPLLLISTIGLCYLNPHHFTEFNLTGQSNFTAFTGAATLTLWSFIGLESATVPAEEAKNPRDIAKATILGTSIAAIIYILSTTAIMGLIKPSQLVHSNAPYAEAATLIFGKAGGLFIAIGALISCIGALNGWTLLQGQIPMAAARDGLFPKFFAKESTRFGTPVNGITVSAIIISILLLLTVNSSLIEQFTLIILLATLSSLIPYFFTALAELMIFIKMRQEFNTKRFLGSTIIAILATIYSFWAIVGSGEKIVFYGSLLFFSGVPVYVWMQWRTTK
ncbi:MAG: Arginine/agmatine antiporter [Legionellaceae bacterium]